MPLAVSPFSREGLDARSMIVATVVRDAIVAMKPGLLRAFFGPERVVEFRPRRADAVEQAAQQTEVASMLKNLADNMKRGG